MAKKTPPQNDSTSPVAHPNGTLPGKSTPPQGANFPMNQRPNYGTNPVNENTGRQPYANVPFPSAAGAKTATPAGVSVFDNGQGESESGAFETGSKLSLEAVGNSGTQIFGGYFSEEYLSTLRGRVGARKWDEMRRSEAQIAMLLNAMTNPIKAATWTIDAYDESDPDCVNDKELAECCIFDMIDFTAFKHEALTLIPFGFSLMEVVHSVELNHPKFGTFNGLKSLAFRSQKTIENWILEPKTGRLLGVNQYTFSDLGGNQFIPGEFLVVFTLMKEGDNYEGISALRPMFGAYVRKDVYLKLAAIGIEKYAVGTPIGTIPKGKEKGTDFENFQKTLQNYTSHEAAYITLPEGWKIEIQRGEFDASKIKEMLVFENTEFANAVVGNFLALGMNGGGGAYALGSNLGEFFTSGIQAYADIICDTVNRQLIPNLIKMNRGDRKGYPKMKVTGISDKAGKEFAETLKFLTDSRMINPDTPLKDFIRKQYKLPKQDPKTEIPMPAIPSGAKTNYPTPTDPVVNPQTGKLEPYKPNQLLSERAETIQLADKKYVERFDAHKEKLKEIMQDNLQTMYAALKDILRRKYNSLPKGSRILTAKGVDMPGVNAYKAALREHLAMVSERAVDWARSRVPGAKNVQLAEYPKLPAKLKKIVDAQSTLVAETQAADVEKMVFFKFTSEAATTDDVDHILNAVDEDVLPTLEDGSTGSGMSIDAAAGNTVAQVTQQSAMEFFHDDEVEDQIESYTFTNEDPVSDICQALADTTFAPDDSDLLRYSPPLHHNCKSRLVPNLKGDSDNPEIDRGGVALTKKQLNSITLGECAHEHPIKND